MTRPTILIIAIVAIIAAVGLWAWRSTSTPEATNNTNAAPVDAVNTKATVPAAAATETPTDKTSASANTSIVAGNTNAANSSNASTGGATNNTNASTVTTNANTAVTSTNVGIDAVLARPSTYNGQSICLTGDFQKSFETQVFGTMLTIEADGAPRLEGPYIGAEGTVTTANLSCDQAERQTCTGTKTLCGRFEVATSDDGFGIQHYKYRLVVE